MIERRINVVGGHAYCAIGGIQAVNRFLVKELNDAGMLRRAFFLWDDPNSANREGLDHVANGIVGFYNKKKISFLRDLVYQSLRYPKDLWLCTHVNYLSIVLLLNAWRKKRVAVFIYAAELDENLTKLKLFALRSCLNIFAISDYTKNKAIKNGIQSSRITRMYIGINDPCPDWKTSTNMLLTQRILFVGRMDERYKGQNELMDAMVLLRIRFPDARLVFVGGGNSLSDWKEGALLRGIELITEFMGRISEEQLRQEYQRAHVFVMLSENEGFGLVYAEAMAHGLPCVAGDRDAAHEVILPEVTGLCVPAGNATALAGAISGLFKNHAMCQTMSAAGRKRYSENFTFLQYRERLLSTIHAWRILSK